MSIDLYKDVEQYRRFIDIVRQDVLAPNRGFVEVQLGDFSWSSSTGDLISTMTKQATYSTSIDKLPDPATRDAIIAIHKALVELDPIALDLPTLYT